MINEYFSCKGPCLKEGFGRSSADEFLYNAVCFEVVVVMTKLNLPKCTIAVPMRL